ncbi:MAG TPA: serine/threonine-protein kinase [Polyangiaceae bacterium]|nr:serine/threonine-protein kinase [Polyangiaceae bacterium]
MSPVHEGQVLAGKYRVERVLGVGGMGVVVAALHLQLDERVALKFLLPEALNNPESVARFAREARAAVKIKSLHVARVSDVGTLETGAPYMVMEFLNGHDLSAVLRDRGPMAVADAVDYVLQACEALAEAHALGIVHRDLKPANLFMITGTDGAPCIKVLDFGISKLTTADSSGDYGMTSTQAIMGSPLYMSPEQMTSSRDVDGRSDIWSVGTILFELLTGRPPFLGDTMPQLCGLILQEPAPPPRALRADLPEGLSAVIMRCLEKRREIRFANVGELAQALAPFGTAQAARSSERISKVLSAAGISSSSIEVLGAGSVGAATGSAWGTTQTKSSKKAVWFVLAGAAATLVAVAAFFMRHQGSVSTSDPRSTATAPQSAPTVPLPALSPPAPPAAPLAAASSTGSKSPPVSVDADTAPPTADPAKHAARTRAAGTKPTAVKSAAPATPAAPAAPTKPAFDPLEGRH